MSQIKTASVDMFISLRPRLFIGHLLRDIKSVQASISKYGLLSPLVVSRMNGKLVVIDGRKRLAAIRKLDFMGRLPRSLVTIPYVELEDRQTVPQTPSLMSNRDLYNTVTQMYCEHQDVALIASELFLSRSCIKQVLTLARLSPRLRKIFFDKTISFNAAKAYAAFPDHKAQNRAFMALGPFADETAILDYLSALKPTDTPPLRIAA